MKVLSRTFRAWKFHTQKCARELGIPDSYRLILMFLNRNPGANQIMIANFADRSTACVNQNVKRMISDGYIRKETDSSDQRYTKLYLTEEGTAKAAELASELASSDEIISQILGKEKEAEIVLELQKICKSLEEGL